METWIARFKECVVPPDADDETVRAFIHYLADRGMFENAGGESWRMPDLDLSQPAEKVCGALVERLETLGRTEKGGIASFFLALRRGQPAPDVLSPKSAAEAPPPSKPGLLEETGPAHRVRASDLSNLQIVKKVGRQLQPFLEMEKGFFDRVMGRYATKEDARLLFNYVLAKTRDKAGPRPWEQLSRRRHK